MSYNSNGLKTIKEYKEAYPDRAYLFDLPRVKDPSGANKRDKGILMRCEDPECTDSSLHFVVPFNMAQDRFGDGLYRCKSCCKRIIARRVSEDEWKNRQIKRIESLGEEGLRKAKRKRDENMGVEGRREGARKAAMAGARKSYETRKQNGTFMRSKLELQIEEEFGGQHSSPDFKYELDCYWPELHKGIEVDDPSHASKRPGYHKEKDDYFKSLGIKVLHISLSPDAVRRPFCGTWKDLVQCFLYGDMDDKWLYMEEDPYHING